MRREAEPRLPVPLALTTMVPEMNLSELQTLSELVAVSRLSRFHLARCFCDGLGLPPHAYQIHVRIERARELLRKGMNSGQVASLVGFSDQSHFTPHVKKIMRVTPSAYARGVAARKSYPSAPPSSSNIVRLSFSCTT